MNNNTKDYKVIVVGDSGVGKTSIIIRFQYNMFLTGNEPTIGASFIKKTLNTPSGPINLNIWDTAGQERYRSLVPMYSRGAHVAIIVFDLTDPSSFKNLNKWVDSIQQNAPSTCHIVIVGNKLDEESVFDKSEAIEWGKKMGFNVFFASAMNGEGIEELFTSISDYILNNQSIRNVHTSKDLNSNSGNNTCC